MRKKFKVSGFTVQQYFSGWKFCQRKVDTKLDSKYSSLNYFRNTLGENIADNGGLKAAFYAYFGEDEELKKSYPVADLPLTADQLFFISYGQVRYLILIG